MSRSPSRPKLDPPLAALLIAAVAATAEAGSTIYVDQAATGAATGTSWTDAFVDLQHGITAALAQPGSSIWVAQGSYRPGPAGAKDATFTLPPATALFGGFSGGETALWQRDPLAHPTVLSGDLDQNDATSGTPWYGTGYPGNALHVVTATGLASSTILDGFSIRGGGMLAVGAGLSLTDSSIVVRRCEFRFNYGSFGGAIAITGGAPRFEDCVVDSNLGWNGRGGGVYVGGNAKPQFRRCLFRANQNIANSIDPVGGAIYFDFGTPPQTIEDCVFADNEARTQTGFGFYPARGGAIFNPTDGMIVRRCRFVRNHSNVGGAIESFRSITIESCEFDSNRVDTIATSSGSTGGVGGAVDVLGLVGQPAATVAGCTFVKNTATDECGGLLISGSAKATVHSSIFRLNADGNGLVSQSQLKGTGASASDIQNFLVTIPGEDPIDPAKFPGCFDSDPLFVDADGADGVFGTLDDDLRLQPGSPCVDVGLDSWLASGLDAGGDLRRSDGNLDGLMRVDAGAREFTNVRLAASGTPVPGGTVVHLGVTASAGLAVALIFGPPGPESSLPPYGAVFVAPAGAVIVILGVAPGPLSGFSPPLGATVVFQAAAALPGAGNLSNPVALAL